MKRPETGGDSPPSEPMGWRRRSVGELAARSECGQDDLARECPLELRVHGRAWMVTLRTPGHDRDLIYGLLRSEGVIVEAADLLTLELEENERGTRALIELNEAALDRWAGRQVRRDLLMHSACGACGKATLEDLDLPTAAAQARPTAQALRAAQVERLAIDLRDHQPLFARTGGVHAAGWSGAEGTCVLVREDVGRHNALDKTIGARLLAGRPVSADDVLVLSGRIGFELAQKAVVVGAGHVVAPGSATDAAVELAGAYGVRLYWFVGGQKGGRRSQHAEND